MLVARLFGFAQAAAPLVHTASATFAAMAPGLNFLPINSTLRE
jgi:hypothetical protein